MTDAGTIASEINKSDIIADQRTETYYVVGVSDVSDLPTVGDFEPIVDPNQP
jgi:hypothetical protein